jgi:uncharacterized Tic20 family protein
MPADDALYETPAEEPIADAAPDGPIAPTADDKQWGMFAHLAALLGLAVGGFTFVGPLIVWLAKKDQSNYVDYHGKESLNFQLNILIYYLLTLVVTVATCGITFPLPMLVLIWSIVMPIIAGLAANKGEMYRYPLTFRMIK